MRTYRILIFLAGTLMVVGALAARSVESATITASYVHGYHDVLINDYGTPAMGTFHLVDGGDRYVALCVEAHHGHSVVDNAYRPVDNATQSPHLDTLLWLTAKDEATMDNDRAVASAALAWFYTNAQRSSGGPVWANWATGWSPVTPLSPEPWDVLAPFGAQHPVGLRSGSTDLEQAEQLVAAIHRIVEQYIGPWNLEPLPEGDGFRLTGAQGPIPDMNVQLQYFDESGGLLAEEPHSTDSNGRVFSHSAAQLNTPARRIVATAQSPGPHREWDGDGPVQRLATATSISLTANIDIDLPPPTTSPTTQPPPTRSAASPTVAATTTTQPPPPPGHLRIVKRSSDPTLEVHGVLFELRDKRGRIVEHKTTNHDGDAEFSPVDTRQHPAPYTIQELDGPPTMQLADEVATVDKLSTDVDNPTEVVFTNVPKLADVQIRKVIDPSGLGPDDLSGFDFSVIRSQDGKKIDTTTGRNGQTGLIQLAAGQYDVCETGHPGWASGLRDSGCQTLVIDAKALKETTTIEVEYVNHAPTPQISSNATDANDGDKTLPLTGGQIADEITLTGLVPGTEYTVWGRMYLTTTELFHGDAATKTFTAAAPEATVVLDFDAPAMREGQIVLTTRLLVGETVVADHVDLTNAEQTIEVSPTTTTTPSSTTTTVPAATTTTTTVPSPTSTTTTTSQPTIVVDSTTTTSPKVESAPPVPPGDSPPNVSPPVLPNTGADDAVATILRFGDIGFIAGISLIVIAKLIPRRS